MAAAFVAIGSAATAAPLNPAYRAEEFEFYLTDLGAKLLVVGAGKDSPAIAVAQKLGVPIARLVAHPERGAGTFSLEFDGGRGTPKTSARRDAGRHRAGAAHLRHDLAAEDRAARAPQCCGVGGAISATRSR